MTAKHRHEIGAGGKCICPKCEASVAHEHGLRCPSCGAKMLREGSPHYDLWKTKQDAKKGSCDRLTDALGNDGCVAF